LQMVVETIHYHGYFYRELAYIASANNFILWWKRLYSTFFLENVSTNLRQFISFSGFRRKHLFITTCSV